MDTLNYSKEIGFEDQIDKEFIPDLKNGCVVELREKDSKQFKIVYKFEPGQEHGLINIFDLEKGNIEVGFIMFSRKKQTLHIEHKRITNEQYKKKGLMSVGVSILAAYAEHIWNTEKITGYISRKNLHAIRARLLVRNMYTNEYLPTFKSRINRAKYTSYLHEKEQSLIEKITQRRINL